MRLNLQLFGGRGASSTLANWNGKRNKGLSDNQDSALESYVSGDMMWINQYLRGRGDFGELSEKEKEYIKDMDSALNNTLEEEKLYRSVDISALYGNLGDKAYDLMSYLQWGDNASLTKDNLSKMKTLANSIIGKEITEKGYMSTTKSKSIAEDFGGFTGSENPVVIDFERKRGLKGRDMKKYEVSGDPQKEVLLNRNTKYKVTGIEAKNGTIYIKAKFL